MASGKFSNPPQPPQLFAATAESITESSKKIYADHNGLLDNIVATVSPEEATFENVMRPILLDQDAHAGQKWENFFYSTVSPHKDLRDASREAIEREDDFEIECNMREDVFKLVEAAYSSRDAQNLDRECQRILKKARDKYVQNGLLLPAGAKRDRFKEIQKRISQLTLKCQELLDEDTSGVWFTPDELEGVPKDEMDVHVLEAGAGVHKGKVKVTFKYDHLRALLRYASHESTRRVYSIAQANRANANAPLFQEVIELRDEAAKLIGYKNHASIAISDKMAETPERVNAFLDDMCTRTEGGAKNDASCLLEYKKRDHENRGLPFDGNLYFWDKSYYARMRKDVEFSVDDAKISQYFPVGQTLSGMLNIFAEILGFVFVKLSEEDCARLSPTGRAEDVSWHGDAEIYSVWDDEENGGQFCGYLYADLYPRDGKYGHDATYTIWPGCIKANGERSYPATTLVCNVSRPSATRPGLLKHDEVTTLFHELGHAMHTLACKTRYERSVEFAQDFVEAPSQMLENWCWTPSVLKSLSQHWETKEQIPDDLVEKLVGIKNLHTALDRRGTALRSVFDMAVHCSEPNQAVTTIDCMQLWNQLRHDLCETKGPEDLGMGMDWGRDYLTFDHLLDGYDAGYYGYMYAEVFSIDMFYTAFKQDPMNKAQGRRYRRLILERGGSIDEMENLKEFLGREPNLEAFQKDQGFQSRGRSCFL